MRGFWMVAVGAGLAWAVAPTAAAAKSVVGCWGVDSSGQRFVETSVRDFGEIGYDGLMAAVNGWKAHAKSLGYNFAECQTFASRDETVLSLDRYRDWNIEKSKSNSSWLDQFEASPPPAEPTKVYFSGSSSRPASEAASAGRDSDAAYDAAVKAHDAAVKAHAAETEAGQAEFEAGRRKFEDDQRRNAAAHAEARAKFEAEKAAHERQYAAYLAEQAAYAAKRKAWEAQTKPCAPGETCVTPQ